VRNSRATWVLITGALLIAAPAHALAETDPMASLQAAALPGTLRCPDGSTRPWQGEAPGQLEVAMACSVSAETAAANREKAKAAWDRKNEAARLEAALHGDAGVMAGLQATWATGRPDYLLRQDPLWFVGIAVLLLGLISMLRRR
jgi:hypothetical protein